MSESVYFLTALTEAPQVQQRLLTLFPEADRFELAADKWMIAFHGGAQELAEKAGVRGGEERVGTGLVLPVTTYSGRAPTTLWDWLRGKGL